MSHPSLFTMAATPDRARARPECKQAATQRARVSGRKRLFSLTDARWLGGRVKPGHGGGGKCATG